MKQSIFIQKAIDRIEKYGWTQGWFGDTETGFCLIGALASTEKQTPNNIFDFVKMFSIITNNEFNIMRWNDTPGRTKEEVLAILQQLKQMALDREAKEG